MAPPHSTHPFRWAVNAGPQWKPSKTQWERLLDLQDEAEKARIKRFHFEKDAKTALVGRLMLHAAASAALGADPAVVKFARSKENKPYLVPIDGIDCDSFNVNLSHHGEWVVLASDSRFLVGCDVMTTCAPRAGESADDFFADFDTSLTENEWRVIRNAGGEGEQLVLFFIHWALKEAYLKATGIGMGIDLDRVEFSISQQAIAEARSRHGRVAPQAATLHIDGKRMHEWHFEISFLDEMHVMAVGSGPLSQQYGKTPDWPHVAPGEGQECLAEGPEAFAARPVDVTVLEVSELLPSALRASYLADA